MIFVQQEQCARRAKRKDVTQTVTGTLRQKTAHLLNALLNLKTFQPPLG